MTSPQVRGSAVREKILNTADELFYRQGIRAIGVDTIIEKSDVAKTTLYRWFPTKDDLIAAFLERRDALFWSRWDQVVQGHAGDAKAALRAVVEWLSEYIASDRFRSCPFQIAATEFPNPDHLSRAICVRNKRELQRRLSGLVKASGVDDAPIVVDQLVMMIEGAFANTALLGEPGPAKRLVEAAMRLLG